MVLIGDPRSYQAEEMCDMEIDHFIWNGGIIIKTSVRCLLFLSFAMLIRGFFFLLKITVVFCACALLVTLRNESYPTCKCKAELIFP